MYWGKKIMYDDNRAIVQLSATQLVKGPCSEQELEAMQFVAGHTSVCLPRIHRTYRRKNGLFILMDFIDGVRLDQLWSSLAEAEKRDIAEKIWSQLQQLRALSPPEKLGCLVVGSSLSGGSVHDGAISSTATGPLKQLVDFKNILRGSPNMAEFEKIWSKDESAASRESYRTVFTHADLAPRNVIRCADGSLYIIDWEFAGWWPAYWEYIKWHFADFPPLPGWVELMDEVSSMKHMLR